MFSPVDVQQVIAQIGSVLAVWMITSGMLWALGFVVFRRLFETLLDSASAYLARQRARRVARSRSSKGAASAPL